jgi:hypothetical protein
LRQDDTSRFLQLRVVPDGAARGHGALANRRAAFRSKLPRTICDRLAVPPKEKVMAVRVLALLIPLAITLPQLQMSRPASAAQDLAASVQPVAEPPWSYDTRRVAEAAVTRVVLESPAQEAVRTIDTAPVETAGTAVAAEAPPPLCGVAHRRTSPKVARAASPVKPASTASASGRLSTHRAKLLRADPGCAAGVHCAPVVVAKITPVARRPL